MGKIPPQSLKVMGKIAPELAVRNFSRQVSSHTKFPPPPRMVHGMRGSTGLPRNGTVEGRGPETHTTDYTIGRCKVGQPHNPHAWKWAVIVPPLALHEAVLWGATWKAKAGCRGGCPAASSHPPPTGCESRMLCPSLSCRRRRNTCAWPPWTCMYDASPVRVQGPLEATQMPH